MTNDDRVNLDVCGVNVCSRIWAKAVADLAAERPSSSFARDAFMAGTLKNRHRTSVSIAATAESTNKVWRSSGQFQLVKRVIQGVETVQVQTHAEEVI